jgi:hypothetical protein
MCVLEDCRRNGQAGIKETGNKRSTAAAPNTAMNSKNKMGFRAMLI